MRTSHSILRLLLPVVAAAAWLPVLASPAGAAPGDLDTTFDGDGIVLTTFGAISQSAGEVLVQSDDKIVTAGYAFNGNDHDFVVARYTPAGALDPSFDGDGRASASIGNDIAAAAAIQPDGKIVVAGNTGSGSNSDFMVVRFLPSGSLDPTFDGDGVVVTPIGANGDDAFAVAVQSDGNILVAGSTKNGSGTPSFAVARYTPNGGLDSSFDGDGVAVLSIGVLGDVANAVVVQPDGRILMAGRTRSCCGGGDEFALVRYTTTGALDGSFDGDGIVVTPMAATANDSANALALQPDGRIVAAGRAFNGPSEDFALARYTSSGALDTSFDTDGKVLTSVGATVDEATGVAVQPDGKIVAGGYTGSSGSDFVVVRYGPSGTLDTSFDVDGKVTTPLTGFDRASAMALQPDGKILLAGQADNSLALVRYLALASLFVTDVSVIEGDSGTVDAVFTIRLSGAEAHTVTVDFTTVNGSAIAGSDYERRLGSRTFLPGQLTKRVTVPVYGDTGDEPDETFSLRLLDPEGAHLDDQVGQATIQDDDAPAQPPSLSVSDVTVTEGNSGSTSATFTISLSEPSSGTVSVDFATSDGTATAPADYEARTGTRTFLPGQTTKTVTLAVKGETLQEPDETFRLALRDPDGAALADGDGVATIIDDDRPTISINDKAVAEVDSGATATMTFNVTLSHAGTSSITVSYATANGTAVAPGDYTAKFGTLTFSVGQTSKAISIITRGDNAVEPNEIFFVNLSNPTNATIADGQGVGTITNDD